MPELNRLPPAAQFAPGGSEVPPASDPAGPDAPVRPSEPRGSHGARRAAGPGLAERQTDDPCTTLRLADVPRRAEHVVDEVVGHAVSVRELLALLIRMNRHREPLRVRLAERERVRSR